MEKILAMLVAAQLTRAAVPELPNPPAVDPELSSSDIRRRNLQVWETFRVFYHGVVGALEDASWRPPKAADGASLVQVLRDLIAAIPRLGGPGGGTGLPLR